MAHTETLVHAPIETVFAVLCDPRAYQHFVVGTKRVRRFDPQWPESGTVFHHTVGFGPFLLRDVTAAVTSRPPAHLVVRPHIRPFVVTESRFSLMPLEDTTLLGLDEHAVDGPLFHICAGPLDALLGLRNRAVVHRIGELAERRATTQRINRRRPQGHHAR